MLRHRAGCFEIRINGWELMSNRAHHSEDVLALLTCEQLCSAAPRVLLAGLGMGYTLRALLDGLPQSARVVVAELLPEVVEWNRGPIGHLAGRPLDDMRVTIECCDVADLIRANRGPFDGIILDVDNGPEAVMVDGNRSLYTPAGLRLMRQALRPGGVLAVWAASPSDGFASSLCSAGFRWRSVEIAARGSVDDPKHTVYIAVA